MTISTTADAARLAWLPNALTWARIAAAPLVAAGVVLSDRVVFTEGPSAAAGYAGAALGLFLLAALSDAVDGLLARRLGVVSALGAGLDHAADKALTLATGLALAATWLPLDLFCATAILLIRDAVIGGLREGLAGAGRALPVAWMGKAKTVAAMTGLGAALALQTAAYAGASPPLQEGLLFAARAGLWLAAALALASAAAYLRSIANSVEK